MSSKEELAALMASDGDFEKKISLLKKAVVTVTKQKKEVEARHAQLQGELSTATQQLAEAQRANAALQRKVKSLEAQLEQERSSGSAFGQNMLKGLSSIMGSSDSTNRGGARGAANDQLSLSPADVERLISENEQLHRQIYTFKTKLEDAQHSSARDAEKLRSEAARLQRETHELRCSLEATTANGDRLRADYLTERALGDFCRHFFVATLLRPQQERESLLAGTKVEVRWPAKGPSSNSAAAPFSDSLPTVVRERAALTLRSAAGTVKTLLRGVSVLAVVLQEQLPSRERATVGDLECLRDRLSVFLEAHTAKKDRLMYLLGQLDSQLSALQHADEEGCSAPVSSDAFVEAQSNIVQLVLEWVGLLRGQLPLLVESCVSMLPHGHSYTMHTAHVSAGSGDGAAAPQKTTAERGEFVEEVTRHGYATLASIEGALTAMRMLVQRSPTAYYRCYNDGDLRGATPEPTTSKETLSFTSSLGATQPPIDLFSLLALQQFWWEGCTSVRSLRASIRALNSGLGDVAEACNKSEIRDALNYLCKCLEAIAAASEEMNGSSRLAPADADAAIAALAPEAFASRLPAHAPSSEALPWTFRPRISIATSSPPAAESVRGTACADTYEELLVALSAADRAAASYYTQMNDLYVEMAEKEDAVQTALEAVAHLQQLIIAERAEAKHTRQALQSQISLLSTQLVEMAGAPAAQSLQ
ncbi:conserved hypothetical protein [Leishmania mexicana MHOM/GT/2001/U1103]|uniref:Uncharacterized protein n=1 Tax=Leishmania mexicana (strain MHOM/GT/2001/U1103) TaxID=929439 RepID=E9ALJ8_LEIMU|nr:conserved hypothetical protein [Leishmania mexicana MHOM/GT/2001/U1103]CBZ23803.1 conserved hypothetical protein [Leishmania mexicana MHOM/GT/2001/U1103]